MAIPPPSCRTAAPTRPAANNATSANPLGSGQNQYGRMWQMGDDNAIDIEQNGKANYIIAHKGYSANGNPYDNGNFYQIGNWNAAKITQTSGGSSGGSIDEINQIASGTATGPTNKLTITQAGAANGTYGFSSTDYNYAWNYVLTVNQTHTGGAMNALTLTQTGGIYTRENKIARADQNGSGNTGTITQAGYLNYTWLSQTGDSNTATVALSGKGNGSTGVPVYPQRLLSAGSYSSGGFAAAVGVGEGTVTQNSDANTLTYTVLGGQQPVRLQAADRRRQHHFGHGDRQCQPGRDPAGWRQQSGQFRPDGRRQRSRHQPDRRRQQRHDQRHRRRQHGRHHPGRDGDRRSTC